MGSEAPVELVPPGAGRRAQAGRSARVPRVAREKVSGSDEAEIASPADSGLGPPDSGSGEAEIASPPDSGSGEAESGEAEIASAADSGSGEAEIASPSDSGSGCPEDLQVKDTQRQVTGPPGQSETQTRSRDPEREWWRWSRESQSHQTRRAER